ncbi:hypothetical protein WAI453_004636 [Rhynchosporium graminicola]|uniref:Uncharacterized protein n=2 Tax=Rhynchosporium TaxID=38037 RepID=A0A1E1M638_RHYSE|nr:uncharacterized protein RCO7_03780 [Rhynchosporium commune]CZT44574.1 uncharacterized protein RSE6_04765 [Rhynchosporium secalis]
MAQQHHQNPSIPLARLSQRLPPLPLYIPMTEEPILLPHLSISTQIPYHDDPAEDEHTSSQPPGYEPMYDYLRSHQRISEVPTNRQCPNTPYLSIPEEQYRDESFVVTIIDGDSGQQPPSYNELYRQNEQERDRLMREFEIEGTPSEQLEEMVKWVVSMLLICFTVAFAGTAFNWGRPS